jgi:hypothetical protein
MVYGTHKNGFLGSFSNKPEICGDMALYKIWLSILYLTECLYTYSLY